MPSLRDVLPAKMDEDSGPSIQRTKTIDDYDDHIRDEEIDVDENLLQKLGITLGGIAFFLIYVMIAVVAMTSFSKDFPDGEWTLVDGFWFAIVTLTTVGYGDLLPQTDGAKIFVSFYIIIGLSTVAGTFLLIAEIFNQAKLRKQQELIEQAEKLAKERGDETKEKDEEENMDKALQDASDQQSRLQRYKAWWCGPFPQGREWPRRWSEVPESWQNFFLVMLVFIVGIVFFTQNPDEGFTFVDALYLTAVTFSTVGYGDLAPISKGGKIFGVFWIIAGVAMTGKVIGAINDYYNELHKQHFMAMMNRKRKEEDEYKIHMFLNKLDPEDVTNIVVLLMMLCTFVNASFINDALFATYGAIMSPDSAVVASWSYVLFIGAVTLILLVNLPTYTVYYEELKNRAFRLTGYYARIQQWMGSDKKDDEDERPQVMTKKVRAKLEHLAVGSKLGDLATQSSCFAMVIALNRCLETTFRVIFSSDDGGGDLEKAEITSESLAITWGFSILMCLAAYGAQACCIQSIEWLNEYPIVRKKSHGSKTAFRDALRKKQAKYQVMAMGLLASWALDAAFQDTFDFIFEDLEAINLLLKFVWAFGMTLIGISFSLFISHMYPPNSQQCEANEEKYDQRDLLLQSTSFVVALAWIQFFTFLCELLSDAFAAISLFLYSLINAGVALYSVSHMEKFIHMVGLLRTRLNKEREFDQDVLHTDEQVFNDWFVQAFAMVTAIAFSESVKNALKALYDPGESAGGTVMSFWVALLFTAMMTMGCIGVAALYEHKKDVNIRFHALRKKCNEMCEEEDIDLDAEPDGTDDDLVKKPAAVDTPVEVNLEAGGIRSSDTPQ